MLQNNSILLASRKIRRSLENLSVDASWFILHCSCSFLSKSKVLTRVILSPCQDKIDISPILLLVLDYMKCYGCCFHNYCFSIVCLGIPWPFERIQHLVHSKVQKATMHLENTALEGLNWSHRSFTREKQGFKWGSNSRYLVCEPKWYSYDCQPAACLGLCLRAVQHSVSCIIGRDLGAGAALTVPLATLGAGYMSFVSHSMVSRQNLLWLVNGAGENCKIHREKACNNIPSLF